VLILTSIREQLKIIQFEERLELIQNLSVKLEVAFNLKLRQFNRRSSFAATSFKKV
jgi:hypothetical protein